MSGTASPRLVPETTSGDDTGDSPGPSARARRGDDRSGCRHVFGAPLVLDRS